MTNLVVVEITYMEGPPGLWYSVVDKDVKDRTHVVAGFLDKAEAHEYVARKRAPSEPSALCPHGAMGPELCRLCTPEISHTHNPDHMMFHPDCPACKVERDSESRSDAT